MFEIKNLEKQYKNEIVLQDINIKINKGMNFIIGASGSGKTTLLKIISGLENEYKGNVFYLGKDINSFLKQEKSTLYNNEFGFVWQDFHLLEDATVIENILLPTYLKDRKSEKTLNRILKQLNIENIKNNKVKNLSGGQKQRVAIARELMKDPKVIFCDEPTSALDTSSVKIVMEVLRNLAKKRTVIIVTHDTSLITNTDTVFELDKGELIKTNQSFEESKQTYQQSSTPKLTLKNALKIAKMNLKNNIGRSLISMLSLLIAGTLLLTTVSGFLGKSTQKEFNQLVETYGEGILDINLVGSFMSASGTGGNSDQPSGKVDQNLNGLYEKYQEDPRVEFVVQTQAFENIKLTLDEKVYKIEKTGSTPVLTKMISGNIPNTKEFQVVVPLKFVEDNGFTVESIIGKTIDFSATIFQWINNAPIEKPVHINATVCGVADNTVVYEYKGKINSYTVDDSFFFNKPAIEHMRAQAGITDKVANFTIRTNSPEDLISLKDELNKKGIVPLGRFELVEDIVRLNQQSIVQSSVASKVIGILAILLTAIIFIVTSNLRKKEYAIYKVTGFNIKHITTIQLMEMMLNYVCSCLLLLVFSPILNIFTTSVFKISILNVNKLMIGVVMILICSVISFIVSIPAVKSANVSSMIKVGDQ